MRKIMMLPIALIGLVSCTANKVENTCKCLKESANDYMLKGLRPTVEDLRTTCKIQADDYDAKEKATVAACAAEVMESVNQKKLIQIDSNKLPDFPTYTFKTTEEFNTSLNQGVDNEYKYLYTTITVEKAYTQGEPMQLSDNRASVVAFDADGQNSFLVFGKSQDFDATKFAKPTNIDTYGDMFVWDCQQKKADNTQDLEWLMRGTFGKYSQDFIREALNDQGSGLPPNNLDIPGKYLAVVLRRLLALPEYSGLVTDLAKGRYKLIDSDAIPDRGQSKTEFSFTGKFLGHKTTNAYGGSISSINIGDAKLFNIQPAPLPAILASQGDLIDVSKYNLH